MSSSAPAPTKNAEAAPKNGTPAAAEGNKPAAQLEEDDEFEDFPAEGTYTLRKEETLA